MLLLGYLVCSVGRISRPSRADSVPMLELLLAMSSPYRLPLFLTCSAKLVPILAVSVDRVRQLMLSSRALTLFFILILFFV